MVRLLWLFLLGAGLLFASSIEAQIQRLLGPQLYQQNAQAIRALVASTNLRRPDGRLDIVRTIALLERVGIFPQRFSQKQRQEVSFMASGAPYLLMFMAEAALQQAGIYRSQLVELRYDGRRIVDHRRYVSQQGLDLGKVVRFLQANGVQIVDLWNDGGWHLLLDLRHARIPAKRPSLEGEWVRIRKSLWLDVCRFEALYLRAKGRWYPKIAIYDRSLAPLDLIRSKRGRKEVEILLPKGACYIKISDRFTPTNLKSGLYLSAR
ncbi:MAG: hypothetical protein C6I00_06160 [Nitratiruptor sp.]|nr:hypothetical protein [Nitratiruptor sp.]NPA83027.1 hypothetical protein [Campylobacterota bacterium]